MTQPTVPLATVRQLAGIVPPQLARALVDAAVLELAARARRDGSSRVAPGIAALLAEFDRSADGRAPAMLGESAHRWLLSGEASDLTGTSARQVRRLAKAGRLIARQRGRQWEIDADSARDYGKEHGHGTGTDDSRGTGNAGR